MTTYRFLALEMFKLLHQCNNIIETTQLMITFQNFIVSVNVWSVHHQLQAPTQAFSRLLWEVFHSTVDQSLWLVAPDILKHLPDFGDCFQL